MVICSLFQMHQIVSLPFNVCIAPCRDLGSPTSASSAALGVLSAGRGSDYAAAPAFEVTSVRTPLSPTIDCASLVSALTFGEGLALLDEISLISLQVTSQAL